MEENSHAVGRNLKRIRKSKNLTQEQVSAAAHVSKGTYQNIERGVANPNVDTLVKVCKDLDVNMGELFQDSLQLKGVRFRSNKRLKGREDVFIEVTRWIRDFNELEEILDNKREYKLASLAKNLAKDQKNDGIEKARRAAQDARHILRVDPDEPIWDICGLLESAGIKIMAHILQSEGFYGLSIAPGNGGPAIVVNVWDRIPVERWIFSAAHELGHLLLHLDSYVSEEVEEIEQQEKEANVFANHFLMPEERFLEYLRDARGLGLLDWVMKVKRVFLVSYKTVLYRLTEMGLVDKNVWPKFNHEFKVRYGKRLTGKSEPEGLTPSSFSCTAAYEIEPQNLANSDLVPERLQSLVRDAVEQDQITMGRAAEILNCSMNEIRDLAGSWLRSYDDVKVKAYL